jgi:large subunit ribosomal protein L23
MTYLIKQRVRTHKAMIQLAAFNKYTFDVDCKLTKPQIKKLLDVVYNVSVEKINTHKRPLKVKSKLRQPRYISSYKRAIIQIKPGTKLPFMQSKMEINP